jgi:hypothetical protein
VSKGKELVRGRISWYAFGVDYFNSLNETGVVSSIFYYCTDFTEGHSTKRRPTEHPLIFVPAGTTRIASHFCHDFLGCFWLV